MKKILFWAEPKPKSEFLETFEYIKEIFDFYEEHGAIAYFYDMLSGALFPEPFNHPEFDCSPVEVLRECSKGAAGEQGYGWEFISFDRKTEYYVDYIR